MLGGDPALVNQLRRLARGAGLEVSIGDSADQLCDNLLARAPHKLTEHVNALMNTPSPILTTRVRNLPPAATAPNTRAATPHQSVRPSST